MMHPAFDPMDIAGLHLWQREESGDNSLQHQRLLQNLTKAVEAELTPRQKEMLYLYYYEKLNMAQIAGRLASTNPPCPARCAAPAAVCITSCNTASEN